MNTLPPFVEALGQGLFVIDTGFTRPRFDASYLMVQDGRAAFIETGTNHSVPRLLQALDAVGLARDAVDYVIPTHVHLDHAGGVGLLMSELPQATLVVHPRGARHMIDPSALYQGALAVYGQAEMDRSYGKLLPVAEARVQASHDGLVLELAGRPLLFADTPGHARHHHSIWDLRTRGWFTGDTFGLGYPEFEHAGRRWIVPTTSPVQFEPEALRASVERLLSFEPDCVYLTHYGRVAEPSRLAVMLLEQMDAMVRIAQARRDSADRHELIKADLRSLLRERLQEHGLTGNDAELALLATDIELNAQGLAVWLDRER